MSDLKCPTRYVYKRRTYTIKLGDVKLLARGQLLFQETEGIKYPGVLSLE